MSTVPFLTLAKDTGRTSDVGIAGDGARAPFPFAHIRQSSTSSVISDISLPVTPPVASSGATDPMGEMAPLPGEGVSCFAEKDEALASPKRIARVVSGIWVRAREDAAVLNVALRIGAACVLFGLYALLVVHFALRDGRFAILIACRVVVHPFVEFGLESFVSGGVRDRLPLLGASQAFVFWYWVTMFTAMTGQLLMFQSSTFGEAVLFNFATGALDLAYRRSYFVRVGVLGALAATLRRRVSVSPAGGSREEGAQAQPPRASFWVRLAASVAPTARTPRELEFHASNVNVRTLVRIQASIAGIVLTKTLGALSPCYDFNGDRSDGVDIVNLLMMLSIGMAVDFVCASWEQTCGIDVIAEMKRRPRVSSTVFYMACVVLAVHVVDLTFGKCDSMRW
eukprot:Opistho-1_new@40022